MYRFPNRKHKKNKWIFHSWANDVRGGEVEDTQYVVLRVQV